MDTYRALGVRRAINGIGPVTFLGGLPLAEPVVEAMRAAARQKVNLNELNLAAGKRVASLVGSEAAFVTTGAAAGLALAAAACLTGMDIARITSLPDCDWEPSRIAINRKQRHAFDHALRATGAQLVDFGSSVKRPELAELESILDSRTAAVAHIVGMQDDWSLASLVKIVALAHRHSVPVIVDAARSLPPASNLRDIPATGADLCCFSGGKAIGGPQNTGFIVGRAELIAACSMNASPNPNTIGRPFKVNAEAIVGLLVALEAYVARDHNAEARQWRRVLEEIRAVAGNECDGMTSRIDDSGRGTTVPSLRIRVPGGPMAAAAAAEQLAGSDPEIWVRVDNDELVINPMTIMIEDAPQLGERVYSVLRSA